MGIIPHNCPHCGTERAAFVTIGGRMAPLVGPNLSTCYQASIGATCPNCNGPIGLIVTNIDPAPHNQVGQALNNFLGSPHGLEVAGLEIKIVWPPPSQPMVPAHVPDAV